MEDLHPSDIAILTLFIIIAVLGSIGNLCILAAIFKNSSLRRITHILIMNQALSDFLLSALSIPLRMLRISVKKSIFDSKVLSSELYCRTISGLNAAILGTSSFGLLLLTVDKFLAVYRPLAYRARMHIKHMTILVVSSWLIPLAMGICSVFIPAMKVDLHNHQHDVACIMSSTFGHVFALISYAVMQVFPLIIMCPLYLYIIVKVKRSWRLPPPTSTGECTPDTTRRIVHAESQRKRESKLTKGILLILGIHILCLTPMVVLDVMHITADYTIPYNLDEVFLLLLHLNAVLDPLIYTRHSQDIKRTMFRILGNLWPCGCSVVAIPLEKRRRRSRKKPVPKRVQHLPDGRNSTPTLTVERAQGLTHIQTSYSNDAYVVSIATSSQ